MANFGPFGKLLIFFGILLIVLGLFVLFCPPKAGIPFIGRLPGDIVIERKNFSFYFPVVTCIIISAILSIIFWLLGRR
ncbi:MAG TPA: DUF2905 domain-containing protein [Candidatus Brocadiia bacterium]|nr:DUF2905 domain-containing protein [Planctomycetota bacterium]MDO8092075.1 DUF2905 domain-containing protein [Candidatus Brocadiales bacterium]